MGMASSPSPFCAQTSKNDVHTARFAKEAILSRSVRNQKFETNRDFVRMTKTLFVNQIGSIMKNFKYLSRFLILLSIILCWLPFSVSAQTMVFDVEFAGRDQDFSRDVVRVFGDIRVDPTLDFSVDNFEANLFFVHDDDPPVSLPSRGIDFGGNSTSVELLQWELIGADLYLGVNPAFYFYGQYFSGEDLLFRTRSPQSEFWEISFSSFFDYDTNEVLPSVLLFYSSNVSIPNPADRDFFRVPRNPSNNMIKVGTLRPALLGDCNQDGVVDFSDISAFIAILQASTFLAEADCNEDGVVDFADIPAFIAILQAA